jgi:hypothetical protein
LAHIDSVVSHEGLTYRDTEALLLRLGDAAERVVVVGGQAVNFWASFYEARVAELRAAAPFTSKDVDLCAPKADVEEMARRLGGQARLAGFDDHTPNLGTVTYSDEGGTVRTLDVMATLAGLDLRDVRETSVPIHYDTASGQSLTFRVMHPVLVMESRAHNVIQLLAYRTPHGLGQARASVLCAREYLKEMISEDPKGVLKWNERIFRFRTKDSDGKQIATEYQIDAFNAVIADPRLDAKFLATRYPQMVAQVQRLAK